MLGLNALFVYICPLKASFISPIPDTNLIAQMPTLKFTVNSVIGYAVFLTGFHHFAVFSQMLRFQKTERGSGEEKEALVE